MTLQFAVTPRKIVIWYRGRLWWRRDNWNADQWAPLGLPGATKRRTVAASKPGVTRKPRRG